MWILAIIIFSAGVSGFTWIFLKICEWVTEYFDDMVSSFCCILFLMIVTFLLLTYATGSLPGDPNA